MPSAIPANREIDALHERIAALEFECANLRKRAEVPPHPQGEELNRPRCVLVNFVKPAAGVKLPYPAQPQGLPLVTALPMRDDRSIPTYRDLSLTWLR